MTDEAATDTGVLFKRATFLALLAYAFFFAFLPDAARAFPFDRMFYGDARPATLTAPEAQAALNFYAGVLGAVMVGWLSTAAWLVWDGSARDHRIVAATTLLWFMTDSTASILTGFWQNAVTNAGFTVLLLAALRAGWPRR